MPHLNGLTLVLSGKSQLKFSVGDENGHTVRSCASLDRKIGKRIFHSQDRRAALPHKLVSHCGNKTVRIFILVASM